MSVYAFVHALPNAWLPTADKSLVIEGISIDKLKARLQGAEIASHVRYEDHCNRINNDLGIDLQPSGINAPSPFNFRGYLVVASLTPGTTEINYVLVHDGTDALKEAGIWF